MFFVNFTMIWERLHNPDFKHFEFEGVKKQAGANGFIMTPNSEFNRVQVEAVKNETESNRFVLTATKWITQMNVIGIVSKAGRYSHQSNTILLRQYEIFPFIFTLYPQFFSLIIPKNCEQFNHRSEVSTMYYTQEQIDRANQADIVSFLQTQGEQLTRVGNEYRWKRCSSLTKDWGIIPSDIPAKYKDYGYWTVP